MQSGKRIIIIAEAGVNHNGDMALAHKLIDAAAAAGADYVKFQTAVPSKLVAAGAPKAEYQAAATGGGESQLDMLRRLMLPADAFAELKDHCRRAGIGFMSTPFDSESIAALHALGQDYFKVPSGEITNLPYLREIAALGVPVIISTGMSTPEEIDDALLILTGRHPRYASHSALTLDDICVLHCNTQYPTPMGDVNLRAMLEPARRYGVSVGYSDHTRGIEVPIAAAALGARVIEKHFTLSRDLPGPDHKASLEPDELTAMVSAIRNVELALGNGSKAVTDSERPNIAVARKSIVAAADIRRGEEFTEANLTCKRPGTGVSPMRWDDVIGRRALRDYRADELLDPTELP